MLGRYLDLGNPVADHPLTRGLVAWWLPLPNNSGGSRLFDIRGTNHGTLTNGPTWGAVAPDGFGALSYTGTAYVALPAISFGSELTISVWIRWAAWQTSSAVYKFGSRPQMQLSRIATSKLEAVMLDSAAFQSPQSNAVDDGAWHKIDAVWVDSVRLSVYQDGVLANEDTTVNTMVQAAVTGTLGTSSAGTAANNWNGQIGGFAFYNRALSAAEILALYDQARRGYPDMLRWWSRKTGLFGSMAPGVAVQASYKRFPRTFLRTPMRGAAHA